MHWNKRENMDELLKIIWNLQNIWKEHFGLYTQYIGYVSPEMVKTILIIKKYSDENEDIDLRSFDLYKINKFARNNKIYEFPNKKEFDDVLPKYWDYLNKYDFSNNNLKKSEWNELLNYLDKKIKEKNRH